MNPDSVVAYAESPVRRDAAERVRWKTTGAMFIECPTCGFEPNEQVELPREACPKCNAATWRRRLRPQNYTDEL